MISSHSAKIPYLQNNKFYQYITAEKHCLAISVFVLSKIKKAFLYLFNQFLCHKNSKDYLCTTMFFFYVPSI